MNANSIFSWLADRSIYVTLDAGRELTVIDSARVDPKILARIEANREALTDYLRKPYGPDIECELARDDQGQAVWRERGKGEWRILPDDEQRCFWDCRISRSRSYWPNKIAPVGGLEKDDRGSETADQLQDREAGQEQRSFDVEYIPVIP